MKTIKFPKGSNGWVPKVLKNVEITDIKPISNKVYYNKNDFAFRMYLGKISDEDATYLILADTKSSRLNIY